MNKDTPSTAEFDKLFTKISEKTIDGVEHFNKNINVHRVIQEASLNKPVGERLYTYTYNFDATETSSGKAEQIDIIRLGAVE